MNYEDVKTQVQKAVHSAVNAHIDTMPIRTLTNDKDDADFLSYLYEAFPDDTPSARATTIIAEHIQWEVKSTSGILFLRKVADFFPAAEGLDRHGRKDYKKWWLEECIKRGYIYRGGSSQSNKPIPQFLGPDPEEWKEEGSKP